MRWIIGLLILSLGLCLGSVLANPPRLATSVVAGLFSNPCTSGTLYGVRSGMTRYQVMRAFGLDTPAFESHWYILDKSAGLPPNQVVAPLWPAGNLPPRLAHADEWTAIRAGYSMDNFAMLITFSNERVTCARIQVRFSYP